MSKYASDPDWQDVIPMPQNDGGSNPLAAISYSDEYAEAMSYLRAIMSDDEKSERALRLTEHLISLNPAHYTVWLYRAAILSTLYPSTSPDFTSRYTSEIDWLDGISLSNPKNYQIWHHRQTLITTLYPISTSSPSSPSKYNVPDGEIILINRMLSGDAKNYHVWSYRQWLIRRYELWTSRLPSGRASPFETTTEIQETELYIQDDVRNNSAWNHRFFIITGQLPSLSTPTISNEDIGSAGKEREELLQREIEYAKAQIRLAPQNQSPWLYISGLSDLLHGKEGVDSLEEFCQEFIPPSTTTSDGTETSGLMGIDMVEELEVWKSIRGQNDEDRRGPAVKSSHALEMLCEIYAKQDSDMKRVAKRGYELLGRLYDPVRKNYWDYLSEKINDE